MLLSVCLITRNEESNLPRALRSVTSVADELVVTDTGSTDSTVELAAKMGARVSHFPWCDDFSAARNFAIDQAHGEWILWLDADEELLASSIEELRTCLQSPDMLGYYVTRRDLLRADQLDQYTNMWQLRLFRRRPELRFRGRCHPAFHPPIQDIACAQGLQVGLSAVTLRHYGYTAEYRECKLRRAAHLLELELRDRPGQLYYLIEYGRTLLDLNDERGHEILDQATKQIRPHMHAPQAPMPLVGPLLEYLMQLPADRLPAGFTPTEIRTLAQRWFPRAAPLLWLQAREAFTEGRFAQAEGLLRTLLAMGRDHSYDQHTSFDPKIIGADAMLNLGVCLVRQAKLSEAQRCFSSLLSNLDHATDARKNLAVIKRLLRDHGSPRRKPRRR